MRLIGDLVVGAFFSHEKDKDREEDVRKRESLVRAWLLSGGPPTDPLLSMQREIREKIPVFHWMVEFPEIFYAQRPDPLIPDQVTCAASMDAFIGNPPFAGREGISGEFGTPYVFWLLSQHPGSHGNTDVSAYFLRRCFGLLGDHGTIGVIATSSIAEGQTRESGLRVILANGGLIYAAESSREWAGEAAVSFVVCHIAKGIIARQVQGNCTLDNAGCSNINSALRVDAERDPPAELAMNAMLASKGLEPGGQGFIVSPKERSALIASDARNAERIYEYIGWEEATTSPTQSPYRFIINFGPVDLETAKHWPDLIRIVEERVRPERASLRDHAPGMKMKKYWWQFYSEMPASRSETASLSRCLITGALSKHMAFCFQPVERIKSKATYVFALDSFSPLAVLQSRIHSAWSWYQTSKRGSGADARIVYTVARCFNTFPFPQHDPRTLVPELEDVGQRLYDSRARYMVDENVGLTITYNRLKDPSCTDPRILELRKVHEEMDRKVLEAYAEGDPGGRWLEVEVPPYCPMNDEDKQKLEAFEDAVIDRLFVLNAKRAEEEKVKGGAGGGKKVAKGAPKPKGEKRGRKKKAPEEQLGLGNGGESAPESS